MNLYDKTLAAEYEFSTCRSANINEWIEAIDPVLKAAGEYTIGRDTVDDITVSETTLAIRTSYSVRRCHQISDMRLPVSILKADNPTQAATRYRLDNELTEAKIRTSAARLSLAENIKKVDLLEAELAALPL